MKSFHVKCEYEDARPKGLTNNENGTYTSGVWPLSREKTPISILLAQAQVLVGGKLYLHEAKTQNSYFGGIIREVIPSYLPEHPNRVAFIFEPDNSCREKKWRGNNSMYDYVSGIVDEE